MSDLIQIGIDVNTNIKQATADLDKMGGSVVSNIRTIDRLIAEVKFLNNALSKGSATEAAYAKGMRQINNELSIFQQRASKATIATNKLSAAQHQTKNRMNGTNMAIQQAGYQFGDFAVQVQSGTSAFVAFSQQATQLAGILPMIASQVGLTVGVATILSSALMILIPIGSAIGRMFMEMGDSADGASKEVKTFEESLTSSRSAITAVDSAIQDLSDKSLESLRERYGEVTTQVLELEKALKRIEIKALTEEVQGAMNTLFTPEFFSQIESSFGKIGSAIVETTEEDLVDMRREIQLIQQLVDSDMFVSELDRKNLKEMNEELAAATGNFAKVGSLVDELSVPQDVLNTYLELELRIKEATKAGNFTVAADGISSMRKLFEDLGIEVETGALANMTRLEGVLREANDRLGKGTVLTRTMSKAFAANEASYQRYLDKIAKANASAEQELVLLTQKNVLLELERQYGKDSSIYNEMALDFEILNLRKKLEAKKIDETIIKGQIEALKIEKDITGQLANQLALKNVIVSKTRGNLEGLGIIEGSTVSREFYGDKRAAELRAEYEALGKETKKLNKGMTDADKAAEKLRKELESPMVNAIESVSNAFGDFIANGLKDFKGFASSILDSFKGMIAQMIATAARNKITLSLGMSGNGGGSVASQAGGSIIGGMAKSAFGSILQGGFTGASAFGHGVTTSLGLGSTINGTVASVLSPTMASVGSIVGSLAGPLLAVGAAFSFLRTRTKEPYTEYVRFLSIVSSSGPCEMEKCMVVSGGEGFIPLVDNMGPDYEKDEMDQPLDKEGVLVVWEAFEAKTLGQVRLVEEGAPGFFDTHYKVRQMIHNGDFKDGTHINKPVHGADGGDRVFHQDITPYTPDLDTQLNVDWILSTPLPNQAADGGDRVFHQHMDAQINMDWNLSTFLPYQTAAGPNIFTMSRTGPDSWDRMFHQDVDAQFNVDGNLSTSLPKQAAAGHDTFTMGGVGPTYIETDSIRANTKNFFETGTQKLSMEVNELSKENLVTGHQLNRSCTHTVIATTPFVSEKEMFEIILPGQETMQVVCVACPRPPRLKVLLSELQVNASLSEADCRLEYERRPGEIVKVNSQKQLEAYLALPNRPNLFVARTNRTG